MNSRTTKDQLRDNIIDDIARANRQLELISKFPQLEQLNFPACIVGNGIDFDNLEHSQVIEVIKAFSNIEGDWTKEPGVGATINYERTIDDIRVRCWQGAPPPSCQIVEEQVFIPEQVMPARVETRRKLVCKDTIST